MKFLKHILLLTIIIGGSLIIGRSLYYYFPLLNQTKTKQAIAIIHPTKDNKVTGTVTFLQKKNGVEVTAQIKGLTPGEHGFHIHEFGDCSSSDASSAGGHFNPTNQPHGAPTDEKRHMGDLGNIIADEKGNAHLRYLDKHVQLNGPQSIIGKSVIIHEKKDDYISQPTGDAGARLGCGIIGIKNDT